MVIDRRYVLTFPDSNVIVIKHWRLHNTIPKDRYKPTLYTEEKSQIGVKPNGAYTDDPTKMVSMSTVQSSTPRTKNTFNKFSQRDYTDEQLRELERQIIQKGAKNGSE